VPRALTLQFTKFQSIAGLKLRALGDSARDAGSQVFQGDPQKLGVARRLRHEPTMTWPWIAENLHLGAAGSLANLLRQNQ